MAGGWIEGAAVLATCVVAWYVFRRLLYCHFASRASVASVTKGEMFLQWVVGELGMEVSPTELGLLEEEDGLKKLAVGRQLAYMVHRVKARVGLSEFTKAQFLVVNHLVREEMVAKNFRHDRITRYHVLITAAVMLPTPHELAQEKALQGPSFKLTNETRKSDANPTWFDVLTGHATLEYGILGTGPKMAVK